MWSKAFWLATLERAVKTAAQSVALAIGAEQVNAITLDWAELGGFGAGGFVLSVLTSVGSGLVSSQPGPSLTNVEVLPAVSQE